MSFAKERLDYLDHLLAALGWEKSEELDGWLPPKHLHEAIYADTGSRPGHYRRSVALLLQVQADEAFLRHEAANSRARQDVKS